MRVLVTGAAGLIGSGVAARFAADHQVIGLDLRPGPFVEVIGDCVDVAEWRQRIGPIDAVVPIIPASSSCPAANTIVCSSVFCR